MLHKDIISHTFLYDFTITFSRLFYLYYTLSLLLWFCQSSLNEYE